ncbi:MAG: ferritin-like domain-containing protein [Candidatus Hodarchaeota archaeon]
MTSTELFELMNGGVAREFQVCVQYMLQHFKMEKILRKVKAENIILDETTYEEIGELLKKMAIEEMKHAGAIMERIYILGGEATTKADKPYIGDNLKQFMEYGYKAEGEALELYAKTIVQAEKENDYETAELFRKIYREEEAHYREFEEYLTIDIKEPDGPNDVETEHTKVYTQEYYDLLGKAAAAEISAIVQYTNQHEKANKLGLRKKETALEVIKESNKAKVISGILMKTAREEMDHLEKICERIYLIGGEPPYNPDPLPVVGADPDDFLREAKKGEDYAIVLYRKIIDKAIEIGDIATRRIFEGIVEDEDRHYWTFDDFF